MRTTRRNAYDSWSFLQSPQEIYVGRYFEYDNLAIEYLRRILLCLMEENLQLLEVGAGTGFFTEILLKMNPSLKITCLEPDEWFVGTLKQKFGSSTTILQDVVENLDDYTFFFDVIITHIVIHNLSDPITALRQMKAKLMENGQMICIEPLASSRHYFPDEKVSKAMELIEKVKVVKHSLRKSASKISGRSINPWFNNYPAMFEEVGLKNIHSYGWTSVFTLSDSRYDFSERKKWVKERTKFFQDTQDEVTRLLVMNGFAESEVADAYDTIYDYFNKLEQASEEELSHIHEQEIVHRIICTGEK